MITLFDDWVVVIDDMSYMLARIVGTKINKNTGRESTRYKSYGYFRDLRGALKAFSEELIRKNLRERVSTLSEALEIIKDSNARVEELLSEVVQSE